MRRVWAIAKLTFAEGVRMRIVLIFLVVLVILVLRMPFALRGDETLAGRLQNFLAYSIGALGVLLSLATVFFSCATLTNEFKESSLHLVVTKPVSRFQILLGKWLGVNLLNLLIVGLCGAAIYGFAHYIQSRPAVNRRDILKLRDVVWTARIAARPVPPRGEIEAAAADYVRQAIRSGQIAPEGQREALVQRIQDLHKTWRVIKNGEGRLYEFENLTPPEREDTAIQVRFKAVPIPLTPDELMTIGWVFCDPDTDTPLDQPTMKVERAHDRHQFLVMATPVIRDGRTKLLVINPYNPVRNNAILFEGEDSLQILYKVGSFEVNFVKALAIVVLRLALLSAVGVFFGAFVSFPVACLCTAAFFLICLGLPFWLEAIGANMEMVTPDVDPYGSLGPAVRAVLVPFLKAAFPDFSHYNGARQLVEGEYISYSLLGGCFAHTLLYGGLLLLLPGWLIFRAREVAEVIV